MKLILSKSSFNKKSYSVVLFCLVFFITTGPSIPRFSYAGDTLFLASLFSIGLLFLKIKNIILYNEQKTLLFTLSLFVIYSFIIMLLNGFDDLTYPMRGIRILINVLGVGSLVYSMHQHFKSDFFKVLLMLSYFSISLHGFIMVMEFLNPTFRDFVYSITEPEIHRENLLFRMAGLTNGGGAGTSLIQFMAILMLPLFSKYFKISFSFKLFLFITAIINLFAMLVSGRTGVFFTFLFVPLFYFWVNSKISIKKTTFLKITIFTLFGAVLISLLSLFEIININKYIESSEALLLAINRLFLEIESIVTQGEIRTLTVLSKENSIPDDWLQFIFGNSIYARENSNSDIGYIRDIFGIGIIGVILTLLVYVYLIYDSLRKYSVNSALGKYIIVLIVTLIIVHYKEPFLFTRYFLTITLFMYFSLLIQSKTERIKIA
jgi:hypothetical protein